MENTVIRVDGMSCSHCEIAIQDAVRKLPGIKKVKANRRKKEVSLVYEASLVTSEQITEAINDTGYSVIA
ncbi:MAG: cation transporter [Clostridiales bacterium]|jgi:copper chaperone|nr:cation transporter [Clostridiales bacterium]